jgi:hypothetical protein
VPLEEPGGLTVYSWPITLQAQPSNDVGPNYKPGGYGIHWPLLDEDVSVGGLVGKDIGMGKMSKRFFVVNDEGDSCN